ncbi:hypothetical protein QCA50_009158 [Cerrena zonata]|uniref:Uncharacterized protein n=1 Tax=Cerrena zonata TaxID=2478898 RepID=A0AAW0GCT6_9APHY
MTTKATHSELNVSLEPHLVEILRPLVPLLPDELLSKLMVALNAYDTPSSALSRKSQLSPLIPYSVLTGISSWARSSSGVSKLSSQNPPLDPHSYSMVALLAGTITSPERKFPDMPKGADDDDPERARNDRRAIVGLLNALLSILGSGAATWWAAQRLSWKNEWRVLIALLVAIVVATSEAILYLIWESRRSKKSSALARFHINRDTHQPQSDHLTPEAVDGNILAEHSLDRNQASVIGDMDELSASPNMEIHGETRGLRERVPHSSRTRNGKNRKLSKKSG